MTASPRPDAETQGQRRTPPDLLPGRRMTGVEGVVLLCALLVMVAGFVFELYRVRLQAAQSFAQRSRLVDSYLQSRLQDVDALAAQFRRYHADPAAGYAPRLRIDAAQKRWSMQAQATGTARRAYTARATGSLPVAASTLRELAAARSLDPVAASLLDHGRDLSRAYYLSANRFLYVLTAAESDAFRFEPALYATPWWTRAAELPSSPSFPASQLQTKAQAQTKAKAKASKKTPTNLASLSQQESGTESRADPQSPMKSQAEAIAAAIARAAGKARATARAGAPAGVAPAQFAGDAFVSRRAVAAGDSEGGLTVAAPLQVNRRLLGVVALDLHPEVLRNLLAIGDSTGEIILADARGGILARDGAAGGEVAPATPFGAGMPWSGEDRAEWTAVALADGRLYLLQRLSPLRVVGEAALRSVPPGLVVVLMALSGLLALRLRNSMLQLLQQVRRDPLTGLLNRRGLYEDAAGLEALARRRQKALAVVALDVDAFRQINLAQGHEVGDRALRALAHGLQQQLREYDVVCRWGGEEFVALLMLEGDHDAMPLAERLRGVAANACLREALTLLSLSAGVALWRRGETLDTVIDRAEQYLYAAKAAGRDRLEGAPEVRGLRD